MFLLLRTSLPPCNPPLMDCVILVAHSVPITLLSSTSPPELTHYNKYLCIIFVNCYFMSSVVMLLTYRIYICKTFTDILCWPHLMLWPLFLRHQICSSRGFAWLVEAALLATWRPGIPTSTCLLMPIRSGRRWLKVREHCLFNIFDIEKWLAFRMNDVVRWIRLRQHPQRQAQDK